MPLNTASTFGFDVYVLLNLSKRIPSNKTSIGFSNFKDPIT